MPDVTQSNDLNSAIDELEAALAQAQAAAGRIRAALPRLEQMSGVFAQLESIIAASREPTGLAAPSVRTPRPRSRQQTATLAEIAVAAGLQPEAPEGDTLGTAELAADPDALDHLEPLVATDGASLTSFRLEFQSERGTLNLRAVDEAIGEHPAVRDVALIDYDGRRAVLKVWITATARPSDIEQALNARADKIASDGGQLSIVALEDAA
jgi:hypothetical protein